MPNNMTIILSDGTRVTSKQAVMFSEFSVEDIVVTLYGNKLGGETHYGLWNLSSLRIAYNLIVNASALGAS
jgi:hypothetical protein